MKFAIDERVKFCKTNDVELDNLTGVILGRSIIDTENDHYVVLLDTLHSQSNDRAVSITEHCLEKVA